MSKTQRNKKIISHHRKGRKHPRISMSGMINNNKFKARWAGNFSGLLDLRRLCGKKYTTYRILNLLEKSQPMGRVFDLRWVTIDTHESAFDKHIAQKDCVIQMGMVCSALYFNFLRHDRALTMCCNPLKNKQGYLRQSQDIERANSLA